jgi:hypothetical protein
MLDFYNSMILTILVSLYVRNCAIFCLRKQLLLFYEMKVLNSDGQLFLQYQ